MNLSTYYKLKRDVWSQLSVDNDSLIEPLPQLEQLVSLNDRLSPADVREVYWPMLHYLEIHIQNKQRLIQANHVFLDLDQPVASLKQPFIIGISGSVAVGKSTTARVLHQLLTQSYPHRRVELMTTDGFLYPNAELERRGIMSRKGFPESYDMPLLLNFMNQIKTGSEPVQVPVYSHEIYDIVPGEYQVMDQPDILIVEGINVFQLPQNQEIYVSDYFDFTIYIDAEPTLIQEWYINRFLMHLKLAKDDPSNYYYEMSEWDDKTARIFANQVWSTINLPNLVQYIAPTRNRADLIVHKIEDHYIDQVMVRKF